MKWTQKVKSRQSLQGFFNMEWTFQKKKKKPALNHLSTRAFVTINNCFNSEFRQSHISAMGVSGSTLVGPCVFDCGSCNCQTWTNHSSISIFQASLRHLPKECHWKKKKLFLNLLKLRISLSSLFALTYIFYVNNSFIVASLFCQS